MFLPQFTLILPHSFRLRCCSRHAVSSISILSKVCKPKGKLELPKLTDNALHKTVLQDLGNSRQLCKLTKMQYHREVYIIQERCLYFKVYQGQHDCRWVTYQDHYNDLLPQMTLIFISIPWALAFLKRPVNTQVNLTQSKY